MTVTFSVPGKTFLVGEYLALEGGPSLLLSTAPRFELRVSDADVSLGGRPEEGPEADGERPLPFAEQSPAGLYYSKNKRAFAGKSIEFHDPHAGKGGLGASSAQFVLLWAYVNRLRSLDPARVNWKALLGEYREVAWNGEGTPPSGADVVSHLCGHVTEFDGRVHEARGFGWKFPFLDFTLLRTGVKLATHEHLKGHSTSGHEAVRQRLREAVAAATKAMETGQESMLTSAVNEFAGAMAESGRVAEGTSEILKTLKSVSSVRAAKGCGAMGADIVLVLHDKDRGAQVHAWAREKGLSICGTRADLAPGLMVHENDGVMKEARS